MRSRGFWYVAYEATPMLTRDRRWAQKGGRDRTHVRSWGGVRPNQGEFEYRFIVVRSKAERSPSPATGGPMRRSLRQKRWGSIHMCPHLTSTRATPARARERATPASRKRMERFRTKSTGALIGLAGFMPTPPGSGQIDREGSGSGVFGALRAPATNSEC
jgi:hypothetical protein